MAMWMYQLPAVSLAVVSGIAFWKGDSLAGFCLAAMVAFMGFFGLVAHTDDVRRAK